MKRLLLLLLIGGFFLTDTVAQKIEIGGFYGYNLNTRARTYYGGQLSVEVASDLFAELTYNRSDTQIGTGASFYVPVAQFYFTAGVFLRFGS